MDADQLWKEILADQQQIESKCKEILLLAKRIGERLNIIKNDKLYPEGEWQATVRERFTGKGRGLRQCQKYMAIAKKWVFVDAALKDDPTIGIEDAYRIVKDPPKPKQITDLLERAKKELLEQSHKLWTSKEADKLKKQAELNQQYNKRLPAIRTARQARVVHFFDSGAFSIKNNEVEKWITEHPNDRWGYYDTIEFFEYMDRYADFVKEYRHAIDWYANVDAIGHQVLSHRNYLYLVNRHGLKPVPVVHYPADPEEWLNIYLDLGHDYIGIGSTRGNEKETPKEKKERKNNFDQWEAKFWKVLDGKSVAGSFAQIKIHKFGTTSISEITKYPYYSCDAITWMEAANKGNILLPKKDEKGNYQFDVKNDTTHVEPKNRSDIKEWLDHIGMTYEEVSELRGREKANILFYDRVLQHL